MATEQDDRDRDTQHAAVKAHSACPYPQNADRVGEVNRRLVEQAVPKPAPQYDPKGCPGYEIVDLRWCRDLRGVDHQPAHEPPTEDDPDDISQRVPPDCQRPDL